MEDISIRELDINKLITPTKGPDGQPNSGKGGMKIAVIGKPGSGKSYLIKYIMYLKRNLIPTGVAFCGTEDSNGFYSQMLPNKFVYDSFEPMFMHRLSQRQKIAKDNNIPNRWLLAVYDDVMDDVSLFSKPAVVGYFKNSRHWDILSLFVNQYVLDFKPVIRTNIDGCFIFREPNEANKEKLYKNFAGVIPNIKIFNKLLEEFTKDYGCLYIHNQASSADAHWTDHVYWFKAPDTIPDFKFGCDEYQSF